MLLTGDVAEAVTALKQTDGPQLQVHGSGDLVQTLLAAGLVDRWHLVIHPVLLGSGRRLFADGTIPASLRLVESRVTKGGTIMATYVPAGAWWWAASADPRSSGRKWRLRGDPKPPGVPTRFPRRVPSSEVGWVGWPHAPHTPRPLSRARRDRRRAGADRPGQLLRRLARAHRPRRHPDHPLPPRPRRSRAPAGAGAGESAGQGVRRAVDRAGRGSGQVPRGAGRCAGGG